MWLCCSYQVSMTPIDSMRKDLYDIPAKQTLMLAARSAANYTRDPRNASRPRHFLEFCSIPRNFFCDVTYMNRFIIDSSSGRYVKYLVYLIQACSACRQGRQCAHPHLREVPMVCQVCVAPTRASLAVVPLQSVTCHQCTFLAADKPLQIMGSKRYM